MTGLRTTPGDVSALVLAGGSGDRMGTRIPKQYMELGDPDDPSRTVLDLILDGYQQADEVGSIQVVLGESHFDVGRSITAKYDKVNGLTVGGDTRHESVCLGVSAIGTAITMIHDAARPLLFQPAVRATFRKLEQGARAVTTTHPPYASMLLTSNGGPVKGVIERDEIAYEMCPVTYYTSDLRDAFDQAIGRGLVFRDEPAMMRALRPDIAMETVQGHRSGFKLTYPEDLRLLAIYRRLLNSS